MLHTAVIGASGYTGTELIRLLLLRNDVRIDKIFGNVHAGSKLSDLTQTFSGNLDLEIEKLNVKELDGFDVLFTSLPSGEAMKIVPDIVTAGIPVIDLSGDFRLKDKNKYQKYYKQEHSAPEIAKKAVYGLPELYKESIENAEIISNPGCYATSIILSLLPALKYGLIDPKGIVINSLSGVSGAGRKSSVEYSFTEINENARAYRITDHQHIPEIEQVLINESDCRDLSLSFIPHLIPVNRGIYTTINAPLLPTATEKDITNVYKVFYYDAPFIRLKKTIPQIKDVTYSNFCDIYLALNSSSNSLIIISVLDNLMKGGAGQAIQNMNLKFKLPETRGLLETEKKHV